MEEKMLEQKEQGKTLVINIRLTRGMAAVLIAALLVVVCVGYLALGQKEVSAGPAVPEASEASMASSSGLRKFYRTMNSYTPTRASTACASGYHFASIWELLDPSNLEYAGEHPDAWVGIGWDMGEGPFTGSGTGAFAAGKHGWIRTGYDADATSGVPGQANCNNWVTSQDPNDYGTTAGLSWKWGVAEDFSVWDLGTSECKYATGVWCVED
jgi:hypothetical protein